MFLWACLVLNYLAANLFYSGDEFMKAVDTLPQELTALLVPPFATYLNTPFPNFH